MTGPERLRIQLQEAWIRAIVREELIKVLGDLAEAAQSTGRTVNGELAVSRAATAAIAKIKERTGDDRRRNGL